MTDTPGSGATGTGTPPGTGADPGAIAAPTYSGADLSPTDVMVAREAWLAAGLPAEQFDTAARADGFNPDAAPAPDVADNFAAFDLPINPTPELYNPVYAAAERISSEDHTAYKQLAADLGLPAAQGNALLSHLPEIGLEFGNLKDDVARRTWLTEQRAIASRMLGGEEAFLEAQDRAVDLLQRLGGKLGKALAEHPVIWNSPYALMLL